MHQGSSVCIINANIVFRYWNVGSFLHDGQFGSKQYRKREHSGVLRGLGPSWESVWNRYDFTVWDLGPFYLAMFELSLIIYFPTGTRPMSPLRDRLRCFLKSSDLSHCYQHAPSAGGLQLLEWVCRFGFQSSMFRC